LIRRYFFPESEVDDLHTASSDIERRIEAEFNRMVKKANTSRWPVSLFFAHFHQRFLESHAAETAQISYVERDGKVHLAVAIIMESSEFEKKSGTDMPFTLAEVRTILNHEIQHIPQVWNLASDVFQISGQIATRAMQENLPPYSSVQVEKVVADARVAWSEVQAYDQQDPKLLQRAGKRVQESRRLVRLRNLAIIENAALRIIANIFGNPQDPARRAELNKWLIDLFEQDLSAVPPPAAAATATPAQDPGRNAQRVPPLAAAMAGLIAMLMIVPLISEEYAPLLILLPYVASFIAISVALWKRLKRAELAPPQGFRRAIPPGAPLYFVATKYDAENNMKFIAEGLNQSYATAWGEINPSALVLHLIKYQTNVPPYVVGGLFERIEQEAELHGLSIIEFNHCPGRRTFRILSSAGTGIWLALGATVRIG
jgi:hypothetical protein